MKTRVELQQHTPIIQFQHEQAGATLRASELKPKIDRFAREELKEIDPDLYKEYEDLKGKLSGLFEEKTPSQYKVHVRAESLAGQPIFPSAPYFGEFYAVRHNSVQVEIFSFHSGLVEFIKNVLPHVLAYNNFGSRQSKGFGCFLPADMKQDKLEEVLCKKYKTFWAADIGNKDPFEVINKTYQLLKGGTNYPEYHKSELFNYMCKKGIRWEKHKIKTELKNSRPDIFDILKYNRDAGHNRIADCPAPDKKMQHCYIRAMLGLAENNEYMVFRNSLNIEKLQIKIKDKKGEIERFRSPITFKVMNRHIYILPEPNAIEEKFLGRDFEFILKTENGRGPSPTPTSLFTIKTPDKFDLIDFLKIALPNVNNITRYNWQEKGCKT